MPTTLLDFQHELLTEGGASGILFGKTGTTYFTTEHPAISGGDDTFGDVPYEREDGFAFGEDYTAGKSVTFELEVDTVDAENPHVAGADALEALETVWTDPIYRSHSGAVAVLRSRAVPGRTRRAYGRPRRYAETTSRLSHKGLNSVVCDFAVGDGKWYDDVEQSKTVTAIPLLTPSNSSITVAGKKNTWPVITITGPAIHPIVTLGVWAFSFPGVTLAPGQSITIDPRPWVRTVTRNDGANLSGQTSATTPTLRKCYLPPGTYPFALIGAGGVGHATVRWRAAYSRW